MKTILLRLAGILLCLQATASTFLLCAQGEPSLLVNGIPWYDQHRRPVNAHGACILREQGKYWLFGEHKSDTTNAFSGFSCYSSDDLVHWDAPELLRVKGDAVPREEMGRMIDPYLLEDKDEPGKYWCFYKQNGEIVAVPYEPKEKTNER